MPIGTPQLIGTNATTGTTVTTLRITVPAGGVPAGTAIIVGITNHNNLAPSSVTDSAGNTYTVHLSPANGTTATVSIVSALNVAALTSGQTITVTWSSARNAAISAYSVTSLATSSALDQTASNTAGSGTAATVGPTATTTQADELVIGAFGYSGTRTFTAGTGYTALTGAESTTTVRGLAWEYKIVSATGAQTATGTFNTTATYAGALATFKAAAGGGSTPISASDTITATDAASVRNISPSASDTITATDAASVRNISPSTADTMTAADSASVRNITPSAADTMTVTDSVSVTVAAPPILLPSGHQQRIQLALFDGPDGALLADWSAIAENVRWSTYARGDKDLTADLPLDLRSAFRLYARSGLPWVRAATGSTILWEGRLEAPAITTRGVRLAAFGPWRVLSDVGNTYTATWSKTDVADWRILTEQDSPVDAAPKRFDFDTNNRLWIAAKQGSTQVYTAIGYYGLLIPSGSRWQWQTITFDYRFSGASGWQAELQKRTDTWNYISTVWTANGAGALQTGSQSVTAGATDALAFMFRFNGVATTYTGETGDQYLHISNLEVKTTTNSLTADVIVADVLAQANALNPGLLRPSTARIQSPGRVLKNIVYADAEPSSILDDLAARGDTQTPPRTWAVGIEGRELFFRPAGPPSRTWVIDQADDLELERDFDTLVTDVQPVYKDATGRTVRGDWVSDAAARSRFGLTRRRSLSVDTTDAAQATAQAQAYLADHTQLTTRGRSLVVETLYDQNGTRVPKYLARAGHGITNRALPITLGPDIDALRSFVIDETTYEPGTEQLTVSPAAPRSALDALLAAQDRRR